MTTNGGVGLSSLGNQSHGGGSILPSLIASVSLLSLSFIIRDLVDDFVHWKASK